jgi:hypothetical protein
MRNGESFRVDAIGASGLKHLHAPLHRALHGGRPGHATADLVRELAQVALYRRWLESSLDNAGRIVVFSWRSCSKANYREDKAKTKGFPGSHIR